MLDPSILVGPNQLPTGTGPMDSLLGGVQPEHDRASIAESNALILAAAIEMLAAVDCSDDLEQAAILIARALRDGCEAARVLILWRGSPQSELRLLTDSRSQDDGSLGSVARLATAAAEEVVGRGTLTVWPAPQRRDSHALMAISQLADRLTSQSVIGVGLTDPDGRQCGVILTLDATNAQAREYLRAMASPLASRLCSIERLQPTPLERSIRNVVEIARGSRRKWIMYAAAAVTLLMLWPIPYKVRSELQLQPVKRRFVAVPFDGPLESAHVRPGDMVNEGDLLAAINPREIEYELAGLRADLNRSLQEKKGLMAEHDFAGSKIAALESDRLRIKSDLLQHRRDNLDIRSPISGMVVSGDLKQSEGMPMTRGETLFEIAPLDQMVVEIAISEQDIAHVLPDMPVEFYVHALPGKTIRGTIDRVHPRSELRDHDNIYIAEVSIKNSDNALRPGMRGRATIQSDRHPLAWNLFHKAYYGLRNVVGW